jgi:hypothetical protein
MKFVGRYSSGLDTLSLRRTCATASSRGRHRQLGFARSVPALWTLGHLPTNPIIYLFADVISGEAVALLDLALKPITPSVDEI